MTVPHPKRPPPPLDGPALERLALRYVERFATTRAKLARYLADKLRARGWAGEGTADPVAVAERMAALGYVDDRGFAAARAGALTRRGLGAVRVRGALRQAGVAADDAETVEPDLDAARLDAALTLARRRRIGPWGDGSPDRAGRQRQIAMLVRGGHGFALAAALVELAPGSDPAEALAHFIPEPRSDTGPSNGVQGVCDA